MPEDIGPPHLHDEALSAVLDGEGGADEAAHALTCAQCGRRLQRFRQVALAVAEPVAPIAAEDRQAAVARALVVGLGTGIDEDVAAEDAGGANVTVLAGRRRRWDRGAGWAAAAAGVAALALAVPLLDRFTSLPGGQDTAASLAQESADDGASAAASGAVEGGDLGDLDPSGLVALVERLNQDPGADAVDDQASRAFDQPSEVGEAESGGRSSPTRGAPENAPPPDQPPQPAERCEGVARERNPDHGPLVYVARARFDGVDAVVLGFDSAGAPAGPPAEILVLAAGDCAELTSAPV